MLINEVLLQEDNAEMKDLMAIAYYVAKWFASSRHKTFEGLAMTLKDIERLWNKPIPALQTKSVKWLVYKPIPEHTYDPLQFVANNEEYVGAKEFGAYSPPSRHIIGINLVLLAKRKKSPASTLLHELDHALVDLKSGGRAVEAEPYKQPSNDYKAYLQHPMEVNARFAQALWDMASKYNAIAKSDLLPTIKNVLNDNRIDQKIVPDPKQYRKLITRSYKFLDEVGQIIDEKQKPGFIQKVKTLIKKWVYG